MKPLIVLVLAAVSLTIQGCGGGDGRHFATVAGSWEIDAQDVTSVDCHHFVGGLTGTMVVAMPGDPVPVAAGLVDFPTLAFIGDVTADGFVVEANVEAGEGDRVRYVVSVSGIPALGDNDTGVAAYTYEYFLRDGSTDCAFTAMGEAKHRSD
jgi:hypothetical protein